MQTRVGEREVTSVFIIAASDVVRAGLESLVAGEAGFTIAGSAVDLSELAARVADGVSPDVVILDAESQEQEMHAALRAFIEGMDEPPPSFDVTQTISLRSPGQPSRGGGDRDVPALIVIGAEDSAWVREALLVGLIRATLPHLSSSVEIIAALLAVSTGLIALDPGTFAAVLSSSTSTDEALPNPSDQSDRSDTQSYERSRSIEPLPLLDALTPREREVLDMLAEGLSNKEIAWRMKISEHTVKFHVSSIFSKLGVSTRTEAVMQGIRQGLIMM
ncbi:MAG: response regulator transcription factor [Acidobacteriota bacterium]|nr:response regulator transcription factor [Acidobacteriota bacterium]